MKGEVLSKTRTAQIETKIPAEKQESAMAQVEKAERKEHRRREREDIKTMKEENFGDYF